MSLNMRDLLGLPLPMAQAKLRAAGLSAEVEISPGERRTRERPGWFAHRRGC